MEGEKKEDDQKEDDDENEDEEEKEEDPGIDGKLIVTKEGYITHETREDEVEPLRDGVDLELTTGYYMNLGKRNGADGDEDIHNNQHEKDNNGQSPEVLDREEETAERKDDLDGEKGSAEKKVDEDGDKETSRKNNYQDVGKAYAERKNDEEGFEIYEERKDDEDREEETAQITTDAPISDMTTKGIQSSGDTLVDSIVGESESSTYVDGLMNHKL